MAGPLPGEERKFDSFYQYKHQSLSCFKPESTNLAICKDATHLPRDWFIAAKICGSFEDKAYVVQKVVPGVC